MSRTSFALLSAAKIGAHPASSNAIDDPLVLTQSRSSDGGSFSSQSKNRSDSGSGSDTRGKKRFSFLHSRSNSNTSNTSDSSTGSGSAISIEPATPPFSPVDDTHLRTAWDASPSDLEPLGPSAKSSRRYSDNIPQASSYGAGHAYIKVDWRNYGSAAVYASTPSRESGCGMGTPGAGGREVVSAEEFNLALRQRSPSFGAPTLSLTPPASAPAPTRTSSFNARIGSWSERSLSLTRRKEEVHGACGAEHHHIRSHSSLNTVLTRPDACVRRASDRSAASAPLAHEPAPVQASTTMSMPMPMSMPEPTPMRQPMPMPMPMPVPAGKGSNRQYGYDALVPIQMGDQALMERLARDDTRRYKF